MPSYRPISLLNYDIKILTKVLATRLIKVLPPLVDIEQTGLMPNKYTDINPCRVFTRFQFPSHDSQSRVLVALDIKKIL